MTHQHRYLGVEVEVPVPTAHPQRFPASLLHQQPARRLVLALRGHGDRDHRVEPRLMGCGHGKVPIAMPVDTIKIPAMS